MTHRHQPGSAPGIRASMINFPRPSTELFDECINLKHPLGTFLWCEAELLRQKGGIDTGFAGRLNATAGFRVEQPVLSPLPSLGYQIPPFIHSSIVALNFHGHAEMRALTPAQQTEVRATILRLVAGASGFAIRSGMPARPGNPGKPRQILRMRSYPGRGALPSGTRRSRWS
jgi:hypothetical protein